MNSPNSVLIEGVLTADPVSATLPNGQTVCNFTVSVTREFKRADGSTAQEEHRFDIEAWAKLGDACMQTLTQGRGIRAVGRLKQEHWTNVQGKFNTRVKIVAEHVEFKPVRAAPATRNDGGAQ